MSQRIARVALLVSALGLAGCAPRSDAALGEAVRRLEARVAVLEARMPPPASPATTPAAPAPAPGGTDRLLPPPDEPAPAAAPQRPAEPEGATLSGAITLSGPYAGVGGRGVALLAPVGRTLAPRPKHARMEQRDRDFVPSMVAVPVGSTVSFPNRDPVFHNVFSLSPAKAFDLGVFKQGESRDVVFDRPGVVSVLCNLHASMSGFIVVHDEPYAAPLDRAGRFFFRRLPPGRYHLRVWHERASEAAQRDLSLSAGLSRITIPMNADQAPVVPPDKEGKPRGARRPRP